MFISNIFELTAEFIRTGDFPIHQPRDSDWKITGWGKTMVTVDIADAATLGATTVAPVNVGAGTTEVAFYKRLEIRSRDRAEYKLRYLFF